MTRTDGRSDGSRFTYWWAYTKATPHYNQGWPARRNEKWAVLLTHMADNTQKPQPLDFFKRLFTSAGSGGLTDYFMDISYGTLDIGSTEVLPPGENTEWYKIRYTTANSPHGQVEDPVDHQMKEARQVLFDEAVRDSGVDPSKYGHIVAVFNVAKTAYGGSTTFVTIDPLDSTTKSGFQTTGVSHEMLHGYGLDHSYDDQNHEYGDQWDIMSAQNDYTFTGFNQANSGPELNAPYKAKLGFLPDSRVLILTPNPSHPQTHTASLAAINRPEANGYLAVKIRIPPQGGVGAPDHAFFIEFRQKSFWDRAIPQDAVLIHEYGSARSFLQTSQKGPQYTQGITFQDENFTVTIQQVHGSDHQKEVLASTAVLAITC